MRPYVELTHTWDTKLFGKHFDPNKVSILQVEGRDIGMLNVEYTVDFIYLGDIQIIPEYQRKGIGTKILLSLIEEARKKCCPIQLKVLNGNPARKLCERHGFKLFEELEHSVKLEFKA